MHAEKYMGVGEIDVVSTSIALFFDYPRDPLNPRLISRYIRIDIKTILIVLGKLEDMRIVRSRPAGKYKFYVLDGDHALFKELRSIFAKTRGERRTLWMSHARKVWSELCG